MTSASVWRRLATPLLPELEAEAHSEICVIGAGIAGLAVAAELSKRGHDVIVLHDAPVAGRGGETERSTAHLVTALDRGYRSLIAVHGRELASLAAASHRAAIDRAQALVERESIECDFSRLDGFLFSDDASVLEHERRAAEAAGVPVEWVPVPLARWAGGELRFLDQAQLDPVRFTRGLAAAAAAAGAKMFGHARVTRLERRTTKHVVHTDHGARVTCNQVVVATNAPVGGFLTLDARQAAYRTYVIGLEVEGDGVPEALYWDTDEPFHYVRTCRAPDGAELLLVGGEDHKTGQGPSRPEERWKRLETWTHRSFPSAGAVRHRWSGQIMETIDGLAFIGPIQPDIHVVTGDCGNGITHALIAGELVPDLIERKPNRWEPVYAPNRVRLRALGSLVRAATNVVVQMGRWITPSDVSDEDAIRPGSGAIVRRGLTKIAAYRDAAGTLHERSATCPHLGCVVAWNPTEATWDCPCHGSRFEPLGEVMHGPANRSLGPAVDSHGADADRAHPRDSGTPGRANRVR